MRDRTAIEKAKDYLGRVIAEECAKEDWDGVVLVYAREALAALEAEKPAEDALELASKIEHGAHDYAEFWCRVLPQWLESYAEAYHAKKCAECKRDGWISMKDRLPPDNGMYFVWHGYFEKPMTAYFSVPAKDFALPLTSKITHWQPLPEAPHA